MADQPKAMSLREAVETCRIPYDALCDREDFVKRQRARAIVDAAVLFIEAREQEWDGLKPEPGAISLFYKLRAIERGEEPKP